MKYLLFMFELSNGQTTITRGQNRQQAKDYLEKICKLKISRELNFNYPHAAFVYSCNHPFDWLNNSPIWLANSQRQWIPEDRSFRQRFTLSAKLTQNSI
jgi:hypothetical protein